MNTKLKLILVAAVLLGVDLAANVVNYLGFSWIYKIPPTEIWDFALTAPEVVFSLAVGYLWNVVIILWFLFFRSSTLAAQYSKNKLAVVFGLLLIAFCVGDWVSNFWAILRIATAVTAYWVALTVAINLSKSFALAYIYGRAHAHQGAADAR